METLANDRVVSREGHHARAIRGTGVSNRSAGHAPVGLARRGSPSPAPASGCSTSSTTTAIGSPSSKATRSSKASTILLLAFLGREDSRSGPPRRRLPRREATARRRLGDVSRRRRRDQRQREGLLRPEADRPRPERGVHAAGPPGDPRPRRGRRGQQLHAVLPGAAGPDFLRAVPGRAARGRAAAQVVPGQPLRGQRLVADDHRAAVDHVGACSRCGSSTRRWASASCSSREPEDWPPLRCPGLAGRHRAC